MTLCDGIAYEYAEKNKMFKGEHDFEKDILACAMNTSKRFLGSPGPERPCPGFRPFALPPRGKYIRL